MKYITLNKSVPELNEQLGFLIKCEFYISYFKYRKRIIYLIGITLLIACFVKLTEDDSFVALKAVSFAIAAIMWLITFIIFCLILIKLYRRSSWKKKVIQYMHKSNPAFQFAFDENNLYFVTDTYKTELSWNYYRYYSIHKNSIFIFPENNIYDALYYSKTELGDTEFSHLETIVSSKLSLFKMKKDSLQLISLNK